MSNFLALKSLRLFACLLCFYPLSVMADTPYSDITQLAFNEPAQTYQYGDNPLQHGEFWSSGESSTLVLLIHGGCWLNQFDKKHIRPLASALAGSGLDVFSIEYRRIGDKGGGWKGTFEDASAALDYADGLGYEHIVTAGHSAGGHLALWLAATQARESLKGAIGLAAISDLVSYAAGSSGCERATLKLMGGEPEQFPKRYAAASPRLLTFTRPTYLIHGTSDSIVSPQQSRTFCNEQDQCELTQLTDQGHFNLIDPRQASLELMVNKINEWVNRE